MSSTQAMKSKAAGARSPALVGDAVCPRLHRAVDLVGRRGTGALVMVLLRGRARFNALLAAIPGLSDRLLSERLRELEAAGVVRRAVCPGPPGRVEYELTRSGRALEPVLAAVSAWADRYVDPPEEPPARKRAR